MKKLFIAVFALLFLASNAYAEPSSSIKYLMNEPVTMLDWGFYKTKQQLKQIQFDFEQVEGVGPHLDAEYDWDLNRINLEIAVFSTNKTVTELGSKEICRTALVLTKRTFGYTPNEKNKATMETFLGMYLYFQHEGFTKKDTPESLNKDLQNLTRVKVDVHASVNNEPPFLKQSSCNSMLSEDEIYFEDIKKETDS